MTSTPALTRGASAAVSAVLTAVVLIGGLSVQRARGGWPFPAAVSAADPHAGHDMTDAADAPAHERLPVEVAPAMAQALGMRLEVVGRETLTQTVTAIATVVPDESRISHVHTRVSGWIEQLDVDTTGELVRAGQPLARIFSQELLASQIEYLSARRAVNASGIVSAVLASGRTRLTVLGMSPEEIDAIEAAGEPKQLVTVFAPRTGIVVNRGVTVGTSVDPSTTLLTIADLSRVWVLAEVPETYIRAVRQGSRARLDFPASGRQPFAARVDFVYPTLSERTRTLRVRFPAANTDGHLRPGLYGTAEFDLPGQHVITVPREAIVDTGLRQHVFVAVGETFVPRPVTVGAQLADRVEVLTGLEEGEHIVAAGVFLLDSESRLRATGGTGGHQHGAMGEPASPPPPPTPAPPPTPSPDPHAGHDMPPPDPHADHRKERP
jgi:membrane fusion protein, copper/silver efflux system